jgi:hypothetical protein
MNLFARSRTQRRLGVTACLLFCLAPAPAEAFQSARALALAGSPVADPVGLESVAINPAGLQRHQTRLQLDLLGISTQVHNNSFTIGDYNRYSGAFLDDSDKAYLLNKVPADGLTLDARAGAQAISFMAAPLAVTFTSSAAADGNISRDALELLLYGNATLDSVSLTGTEAETYLTAAVGVSYAQPVARMMGGTLTAGATLRYVKGLWIEEVSESQGQLITSAYGIDGDAYLAARTASGGGGVSADLGFMLDLVGGWTLATSVTNLLGTVNWSGNPEGHLITFAVDSLSVLNAGDDNLMTSDDSTYAIESFSTRLPAVLRLGASRQTGQMTWMGQWEQGLNQVAGGTTSPRISGGLEWWATGTFPLRAGLAAGGGGDIGASGGSGVHAGVFYFDIGFGLASGPVWGQAKGFELALNTGLRF